MKMAKLMMLARAALLCLVVAPAVAQNRRWEELANLPFPENYPTQQSSQALLDELTFQRAVQAYLWALPAMNMYGMKEGSEKVFGKGYNVLPVFKQRLNAKTLVTTPNSDVIYAMGYLDLKEDGPLVIEVPPKLQGLLDDFWQRPLCDVGFAGPDQGLGGKYLILPPDYKGEEPKGYFTFRSRTYGVFVFWRAFYKDPTKLDEPVSLIEQTRIYPLGKEESARPMIFPDASAVPANMLYPGDGSYYDMLDRFIQHEYVDPTELDMRGMLLSIGIVKGKPFAPDAHTRAILEKAAAVGLKMSKVLGSDWLARQPGAKIYEDRQWVYVFTAKNPEFKINGAINLDMRVVMFAAAYSTSPAMVLDIVGAGAKYPSTNRDADGKYLSGGAAYRLSVPAHVPVNNFWSVTVYDAETASGLDNGQPFPSVSSFDKPVANSDGSTDIYFGPSTPQGHEKNWLRTIPGKGYFVMVRLYGPTQPYFDKTWKLPDIEKMK
jgi:hypothetical protein